jgi:chorismate synthase
MVSRLRMTTAGESHGPYEVCIIEGIPARLALSAADVDAQLARRQRGYGRGARMAIEIDRSELVAGVRLGYTLGSPVAIGVRNSDHKNWVESMSAEAPARSLENRAGDVAVPRPGHADFAGMLKYGHTDIRSVLERASARETVARVAGGAVCRKLLAELGVEVRGRVVRLGGVVSGTENADLARPDSIDWEAAEVSPVGCDDAAATQAMCEAIDGARDSGESLGGVFEVWCWGLCPGLGSYASMEDRLDGRLMGAVGSIPAIKGVEVGRGFANADSAGSAIHDAFAMEGRNGERSITRTTNRAGGLEGGMTNGMPVVVRAGMKPIPTLTTPLPSVDLRTLEMAAAHVERSDVTAVAAARVVGEAMVAYVIAGAYVDKFGGDSMEQLLTSVSMYLSELEDRGLWRSS